MCSLFIIRSQDISCESRNPITNIHVNHLLTQIVRHHAKRKTMVKLYTTAKVQGGWGY